MKQFIMKYLNEYMTGFYLPTLRLTDILEIIIIAFLLYQIILWIKNTKAWMLLKGILVLGVFILGAAIFRMYTILWIAQNLLPVMATAAVIIFQPELRRALEKLGEKQFLTSVVPFDKKGRDNVRFSETTVDGIVEASFAMGAVKTGALIVVEQAIMLSEYEVTGIRLDCIVSPQVLLNIFEHNTPLHDGAIIIRGDRIVSATCYLPLSDNMGISKELGTRHRAAIGMSEVSDAMVIAVSEETGYVSVALGGQLVRNITPEYLRERLESIQNRRAETSKWKTLWKGRQKHEKGAD
ncbi:diadenylate cyclase CdaA [Bariatricus massiliensis]|uniref:Diadenylate cyclase n=1 Tax=Bariatricus massiliensis TaxID=1745713 RepID=A0ABS8DIV4_9FIRM|nr:diadenylate cyclase CdaA [Bariatricus massiliensis]MCB7305228.1 diadenylate cyclase CdaA [Bariatricus massiliensis]MCB7375879.1 diadenylate cyclase CdaA [Bariatricus massiliensis]MCB7388371.1 diadenylate cyclase CdaA [Bariatricus massiliensis]MCB7412641.1 diadenylate cyclase CdaA [Bariatricus massiliensis]MCQ5254721.1 diadenylate cyclase CdaA [Bariatricus massiliensis]